MYSIIFSAILLAVGNIAEFMPYVYIFFRYMNRKIWNRGLKKGTNVASVGSVFNDTRKVKVLSLPENDKGKIDVSSEGPSWELVVGVGENHACFYTIAS